MKAIHQVWNVKLRLLVAFIDARLAALLSFRRVDNYIVCLKIHWCNVYR